MYSRQGINSEMQSFVSRDSNPHLKFTLGVYTVY
ncbi:hypothetical protein KPLM21_680039 [Klebsiella pneumoniae]|nr:hypothetical protein KPLM21_680039 [Klebsiella pneumoniae]